MISVTILTKNSQETLTQTLESLKEFSEVLILDTGSTDRTIDIASKYPNVKIQRTAFLGFGPTHNLATSLASYDWILSVDSDEILSPELAAEIRALALDPRCVYSIPRFNYFNGKHIKWCGGWHPDQIIRMYNRKSTRFSEDMVHERILSDGLNHIPLRHPMHHTPYRKMSDFLAKMQNYSSLFAQQNRHKKPSSLTKAILHGWFAFFKSYLLKRGFLGGREGLIISIYNAQTTFYKYLKLAEENRNNS